MNAACERIHFHASTSDAARDALAALTAVYGQSPVADADVIVARGWHASRNAA